MDNIESRLENDVNGGLTFHKISVNLVIIPAFNSMWKPRDDPTGNGQRGLPLLFSTLSQRSDSPL